MDGLEEQFNFFLHMKKNKLISTCSFLINPAQICLYIISYAKYI